LASNRTRNGPLSVCQHAQFCVRIAVRFRVRFPAKPQTFCIRALSAHSAAEFNISPGRWQRVWLVAIVPTERWGKMDRNDCHTAWGKFKTLISSPHHYTNYACYFSLIGCFLKLLLLLFLSLSLSIAIYRLQVTTCLTLA
jgi:hypothetical protein